jgi:hypothetical protein
MVVNQPFNQLKRIDIRQDKLRTRLSDIEGVFYSPQVRLAEL